MDLRGVTSARNLRSFMINMQSEILFDFGKSSMEELLEGEGEASPGRKEMMRAEEALGQWYIETLLKMGGASCWEERDDGEISTSDVSEFLDCMIAAVRSRSWRKEIDSVIAEGKRKSEGFVALPMSSLNPALISLQSSLLTSLGFKSKESLRSFAEARLAASEDLDISDRELRLNLKVQEVAREAFRDAGISEDDREVSFCPPVFSLLLGPPQFL